MPDFQYIAREQSGQQVSGTLSAASEQDALGHLASRRLFPVELQLAEASTVKRGMSNKRVGARHLAVFFTQLADLLRSGVPLLRSLELLERQATNPRLKQVIQGIREEVADGTRLADALKQHPRVFSELAVSMVLAGEEGGFLEDVLKRIAAFTEHQEDLKSRVVGTMVYPIFLLVMGALIVVAMLVFFVPKFAPIFDQMEDAGQLPWATTTLMGISEFLSSFGLFIIVPIAAAGWWGARRLQTDEGRWYYDRIRLWSISLGPVQIGMGPIVRSLAISRFCRILGTLLQNGVPILQSMNIAKDATGNRVLSQAIGEAAENISSGKSLAEPLAASRQFPEEVVEMIAVGEESNNLEQVLLDIADNMERRTNRQLELFVRLLEPILLLLMAGLVLFVVAALLLPILQSSGIF